MELCFKQIKIKDFKTMLTSSHRLPKSFKDKANQKVAKISGSLLGAVTPE